VEVSLSSWLFANPGLLQQIYGTTKIQGIKKDTTVKKRTYLMSFLHGQDI
jgi:hypothetical protein